MLSSTFACYKSASGVALSSGVARRVGRRFGLWAINPKKEQGLKVVIFPEFRPLEKLSCVGLLCNCKDVRIRPV